MHAHAAGRPSAALWTSIAVLTCLLAHEAIAKSLSNSIALLSLAIPPLTLLNVLALRWEAKVDVRKASELFWQGFGPGFLLLLFVEMLFAATLIGYYCYGEQDCTETLELLRDFRKLPKFLYQNAPLRGFALAFVLSFFTAGMLEEGTKLFFVSLSIEGPEYVPLWKKKEMVLVQGEEELSREVVPDSIDHFTDTEAAAAFAFNGGGHWKLSKTGGNENENSDLEVTSGHGILLYFIAFSFGLATSESMLYLCCLARTPSDAIQMSISRLVFSLPMHAACGCLTALGLIARYSKENVSLARAVLPSVLLHGFFDFVLLVIRAIPLVFNICEDDLKRIRYVASSVFLFFTMRVLFRKLSVFFFSSPF